MNNTEQDRKFIKVTRTMPGYHHTDYEGECGPDVTIDDIKKKFYSPYFGGRNARVCNGKWSATRHDD